MSDFPGIMKVVFQRRGLGGCEIVGTWQERKKRGENKRLEVLKPGMKEGNRFNYHTLREGEKGWEKRKKEGEKRAGRGFPKQLRARTGRRCGERERAAGPGAARGGLSLIHI